MYRELVDTHITNRGLIVEAGRIEPYFSKDLRYCSLFMFGKDIIPYVKTQKSVKGFTGKVYSEAVWIDVDFAQDVNAARLSTIEIIKRLNAEYGINPEHLFIYFSGLKGFHIALYHTLVGFTAATAIEPEQMKTFVKRLTSGIEHVDLIIYEPVRIFRIENSRHEKSGLYKIRLSFDELQCELDEIKKLAANPRIYPFKKPLAELTAIPKLQGLWQDSTSYKAEQEQVELKGNLFEPPPEGSRNKTLLVQACTLFRKSELSEYAIQDIVWNAARLASIGASENIEHHEVKRIVANAKRLVGDERKKVKSEELNIKSFGEWIPDWENYILQQQTPMSLLFSELNKVKRGRLRGNLGVIMGYGGSKKSLYALNTALRNINENGDIAIYSTMEMSAPQLINRIIDHEVKPMNQHHNASVVLESIYKNDLNEGRKYLYELSKKLGNKLQIVSNSRMTYEYYKLAIQKVKETTGTPSILVVDGLSMMGGKGSETEQYGQNSADLKELANEENMLVLLICHVSKGADKHTRDLSKNIRSSEKILDNCDFYMTLSQIEDENNPENYNPLKGFVNFNDKRGTGVITNLVYDFNPQQLHLKESNESPKQYMERKKKLYETDF